MRVWRSRGPEAALVIYQGSPSPHRPRLRPRSSLGDQSHTRRILGEAKQSEASPLFSTIPLRPGVGGPGVCTRAGSLNLMLRRCPERGGSVRGGGGGKCPLGERGRNTNDEGRRADTISVTRAGESGHNGRGGFRVISFVSWRSWSCLVVFVYIFCLSG